MRGVIRAESFCYNSVDHPLNLSPVHHGLDEVTGDFPIELHHAPSP